MAELPIEIIANVLSLGGHCEPLAKLLAKSYDNFKVTEGSLVGRCLLNSKGPIESICHASKHGHTKAVQWLYKNTSLCPSIVKINGKTPLHLAAQYGHLETVRALVTEFKANVKARDDDLGMTPLHLAAEEGHLEIVQVLVEEFKANVDARDELGRTPLHRAALYGHLEIVRALVADFKANAEARDDFGRTPNGLLGPRSIALS